MSFFIKKINLLLLLIVFLFFNTEIFGKTKRDVYSEREIASYFLGILSSNDNNNETALKYLNKAQSLKDVHNRYNIKYIRTLVLLEKYRQAINYSESIWNENEYLFESDLLLGLNSLLNEDYSKAKKHFFRIKENSKFNQQFEDFISGILLSWSEAGIKNKEKSLYHFEKIPNRYTSLKRIQNCFLNCYFNTNNTESGFKNLIKEKNSGYSRYSFFLANYLLHKNQEGKAKNIISASRNEDRGNLLLKQSENFILNNKSKKIKNVFNCENLEDNVAEIFYMTAVLFSGIEDYKTSNFYLKISLYLNNKFTANKTLLAENFYYQKQYKSAKKIYLDLKEIGPIYAWHASKSLAIILSNLESSKKGQKILQEEFNLINNPNFEHYYELANFYNNSENYKKAIEYYSFALKSIDENHFLVPKILDRRGTCYEKIGEWDNAEKDLMKSLEISPSQPYVLNYLAYSWVVKGKKITEAIKMLERANSLKEQDGYIIDSLGWAYYANKNYIKAEKFLQRAVELMPTDPVINDHYADVLWKLNKNIQARYFWELVLNLDETEEKLKKDVNEKLIFGI